MSAEPTTPLVSVIMANFNGAPYIAAAVRSVLRQTLSSLELIVSDDGSTDRSLEVARDAAGGDRRLIVVEGGVRTGPAAARNRALRRARGRWIAIVDSDDFIHPMRLATLIGAAERDGADIAVDDLVVFYENGARPPRDFLEGSRGTTPSWITTADFILSTMLYSSRPSFGYLKPVVRAAALKSIAYDETLRIAEDYHLLAELMLSGARMRLYPEPHYFYRKHARSISHRLSGADLDSMIAALDRLAARAVGDRDVEASFRRQRASFLDARAFADLVDALKARSLPGAIEAIRRRPATLWLLRWPVLDRIKAFTRRQKRAKDAPRRRIALLSRQRIVGATNGSSAYVLGLARALTDAGFDVDFIGASPKAFGRWPVFRLRPEIGVFASYVVHGGVRIGPLMLALDPRVALRGGVAAAAIVLRKLLPSWSLKLRPADYAIGAPSRRSDLLYVARQARPGVCAVLCDYAFLAQMALYVLAPEAPVVTIMHDLMSARVSDPTLERVPEAIANITADEEYLLLSLADIVVAIQAEEADQVRAHLPSVATIVAPLASRLVAEPQPGQDDALLFVGSNTVANVAGLQWFLEACWPLVRAARPNARLQVAGSVGRALTSVPPGVHLLGVVASLDDLYRAAGVVIAPLRTGSGLKIKLVEALAAGKAVVGTTVAAQGVAPIVERAMSITDDPQVFAADVIRLAQDEAARAALSAAALSCARTHFSPAACYGPLIGRLETELDRRSTPAAAPLPRMPLSAAISSAGATK